MTKPTSQTFSTLLAAEQPNDILQAIAKCIWEAHKNEGDPPIPRLSDIQEFTSVPEYPIEGGLVQRIGECYFVWQTMPLRFSELPKNLEEGTIFLATEADFPEGFDDTQITAWTENIVDENRDEFKQWLKMQLKDPGWPHLKKSRDFNAVSNYLLQTAGEPTQEGAQWLHQEWKSVREQDTRIVHPITTIVREWIQTQTAKPITLKYDRHHPIAVLKHPMGSVREMNFANEMTFADSDAVRLREFHTPEKKQQIIDAQMRLDLSVESVSLLPPVMPLEVAPHPLPRQTKSGQVSHVLRIFLEALMALDPKENNRILQFTLGDLIKYLYPDGKFHRTNQLGYILDALFFLSTYATVPYQTESGRIGRWRPVFARNTLPPDAKDEDIVYLDVRLPPDARQGMLVEKEILRQLGKESAPKFSAYLTACWLWDKYGTTQKGIIDPTKPIENRDEQGYLLNAQGNRIRKTRGKPVDNLYHPAAIKQLPREANPARDRYPILPFDDLVLSCIPNPNPRHKRRNIERVKQYWDDLQARGVIEIEKFQNGWRILPSQRHLKAYRAMQKAQKNHRNTPKKKGYDV